MNRHQFSMMRAVALPALLVLVLSTSASGSSHEWSHRFGSTGTDTGVDTAVDPDGNMIAFGEFRGSIEFGGDHLASAGYRDLYVAKLDPSGGHVWSIRFGSAASETAGGVAVDSQGNIYITGTFRSAVDFGGGPLMPAGDDDVFLVMLDSTGTHVWSHGFGDGAPDVGVDVAVEDDAFVYVTGTFGDTVDFGGDRLVSRGGPDGFVAKFKTSEGSHEWSMAFGDGGVDGGVGLAVDVNHDVLLTGYFEGTIGFGGAPLSSQGDRDVFLVKLDPSGSHVWSESHGGSRDDLPGGVAVDPARSIGLTGSFQGNAAFGGATISSHGDEDIFLARYDRNGGHIWSQGFGGPGTDLGSGVALDANKDLHITGRFHEELDFGGGSLISTGDADLFVARFENTGAHMWSHAFGGGNEDRGEALALDGSGNVFVSGCFGSRPADFGGDPVYSRGWTLDVVLASYDAAGVHRWSDGFGSLGFEEGMDLASDASGNLFVTGTFCGSVGFGGDVLVSSGSQDIYLASYDDAGNHRWSRSFASSYVAPPPGQIPADEGRSVATDPDGNVFLAGLFEGTVDFGGGPLTAVGNRDIFLAKYDGDGVHLWSRRFGSIDGDGGYAVATDAAGNVYLTGYIHDPVDFGGGALPFSGAVDAFVAVFGPTGVHRWSRSLGGPESVVGASIAADADGNVIVAGKFESTADFGGGPIISQGDYDVFLARYDTFGQHLWSHGFGGDERDEAEGIDVDGAGNVYLIGNFRGSADFGGGVLVAEGTIDAFLVSHDPDGAHRWSRRYGGDRWVFPRTVQVDDSGRLLLAGAFAGTIDFGGGELVSESAEDVFLAGLTASGHHLWSERFGGYGQDLARCAIPVDPATVALTGRFYDSIDFGGGELICTGGYDMFVAQLGIEIVGIDGAVSSGGAWGLHPARPNPFAVATTVMLDLPDSRLTTITVFDVSGRRVRTLLSDELPAGQHAIVWDGRDGRGRAVQPGVYAIRVEDGHGRSSRTVVRTGSR